jgi:hypothetical protein
LRVAINENAELMKKLEYDVKRKLGMDVNDNGINSEVLKIQKQEKIL